MYCENCFCVYENDGYCRLESIELDISGVCASCRYVIIPDKLLKKYKKEYKEYKKIK